MTSRLEILIIFIRKSIFLTNKISNKCFTDEKTWTSFDCSKNWTGLNMNLFLRVMCTYKYRQDKTSRRTLGMSLLISTDKSRQIKCGRY